MRATGLYITVFGSTRRPTGTILDYSDVDRGEGVLIDDGSGRLEDEVSEDNGCFCSSPWFVLSAF